MTGHRAVTTTFALAVLALAACGGRERQDADEQEGSYTLDVTTASFPASQRVGRQSRMRVAVKNTGAEALKNVAVAVDSFSRRSEQPGLADAGRPVWIVDESPGGGTTAFADTWALEGLAPGETKPFRWTLTPVEAGSYRVKYTVRAGLDGKARTRGTQGASSLTGTFAVRVSRKPSAARVNPETGVVERSAR